MTDEVTLRSATSDDAPALAALARESFVAAFGPLYKSEDLAAFLSRHRSEDAYRAKLADPNVHVQLAFVDGTLGAYALIVLGEAIDGRPDPQPARPMFLSQLYCAGHATGRGVGARLMDWTLAEARAWGADAIQLSVYNENFGAQRFYQRYGFEHVGDIHFWVGNKRDDEFLYELSL